MADVKEVSSYSFRRVGPTLAKLVRATDVQLVALGNWVDKGSFNHMPRVYDAGKMRRTALLKLAVRDLCCAAGAEDWESLDASLLQSSWPEASVVIKPALPRATP